MKRRRSVCRSNLLVANVQQRAHLNVQVLALPIRKPSGVEIPVIETESVAPKETEASAADHCFFTIDGLPAGSDADRLAPGIYIERDHGKTRKFIKH